MPFNFQRVRDFTAGMQTQQDGSAIPLNAHQNIENAKIDRQGRVNLRRKAAMAHAAEAGGAREASPSSRLPRKSSSPTEIDILKRGIFCPCDPLERPLEPDGTEWYRDGGGEF